MSSHHALKEQSETSIPIAGADALGYRLAAWLLLIGVFAFSVYRAATQPIAHDESLEYTWFLDGGVLNVLRFNSTNHILFTLLAKPCVKLLGLTELTLRLPTLLGSALYLIGAYLLTTELFGRRLLMILSLALLCLNPTVMDFMVAARGYGLGLAFLVLAMYLIASFLNQADADLRSGRWRAKCRMISVLLALSVAASLTNLIPAAGLGLLLFIVVFRLRLNSSVSAKNFVWESIAPGAALGLLILWPFLIQARPAQFNMALASTGDSLRDNFNSSFLYKWTGDIYSSSLGALPPAAGTWQKHVSDFGTAFFLPLLFLFLLLGLIALWRMKPPLTPFHLKAFAFSGAAVASVIFNILLHFAIHMNYPVARTALYFVPLFTVATILVAEALAHRNSVFGSWLKVVCILVALLLLADYGLSLNPKYFRYNEYDLVSRSMFQTIDADAHSRGLNHVRIGGTWWYQPELDFLLPPLPRNHHRSLRHRRRVLLVEFPKCPYSRSIQLLRFYAIE